jgi:heat shock protein HslJ
MTTSRLSPRRPAALWAAAALSTALLAACAAPSHNRDANTKDSAMPSGPAAPAAASNGSIDLGGYRWTVETATDKAGKPITVLQREGKYALTLSFVKDRLGVSGGCNHVGAQYAIKGAQLEVKEFQTTLMACQDPRLMQMDAAISQQLQGRNTFAIEGDASQPRLRLTTAAGNTLNLSGEATAETRYGGAGATVFLEVDAQRRACPHPLIRDHQCLWVRERSYDANGVALKPSDEWHFLYQDIEGYKHEAGIRNVVRVKKFQIKNPPADAPSVAYVLDMVVESEMVPAP